MFLVAEKTFVIIINLEAIKLHRTATEITSSLKLLYIYENTKRLMKSSLPPPHKERLQSL